MLHDLIYGNLRIVDQCDQAVNHLIEVLRRNVGRHADSNTGCTVHQHVRHRGRKHRRLLKRVIEVQRSIDRLFFQILEHLTRDALHSYFGITHGSRRVAVDRPEVTLTVNQRVAHGKILDQAHDTVIHRVIAVRVKLTQHLTNHTGGLLVRLSRLQTKLMHAVEHPPVDRLETVTNIRQRTAHYNRHGIIEVGVPHFIFYADR